MTESGSDHVPVSNAALRALEGRIAARLEAIEHRVAALEGRAPGAARVPAAPVRDVVEAATPVERVAAPPPLPRAPMPELLAASSLAKPGAALPVKVKGDLERLIGGRWYAAVGALIVMIGIVLGLKYAYDAGWMKISPTARCLAFAAFGGVLLGAAELIRRRVNAMAAAAVFAAGLGTIYASAFAAYRLYDLVGPATAFGMLAAVAMTGVGLSALARQPLAASLSLAGGFVTPLFFFDQPARPYVLPAYLLTLAAIGLSLAAWKRAGFLSLRTICWWGVMVMGGAWVLGRPDNALEPIVFLPLAWAMFHAELAYSSRRGLSADASHAMAQAETAEEVAIEARPLSLTRSSARAIASSFSTTAWAVVLGMLTLDQSAVMPVWVAPLAAFVGAILIAIPLAGHLRVLVDRPINHREALGAGLLVQAAAALLVTVATGTTGLGNAVAWLALALASGLASRWLGARTFAMYSLISLLIGTLRIVVFDLGTPGVPLFEAAGLAPRQGSLLLVGAAVVWAVQFWAWRAIEGARWQQISHLAAGIAAGLAVAAWIPFAQPMAAMVVASAALLAMALVANRLGSAGVLGLASIWGAAVTLGHVNAWDELTRAVMFQSGRVVVTGQWVASLALGASWLAVAWAASRRDGQARLVAPVYALVSAVVVGLAAAPIADKAWGQGLWAGLAALSYALLALGYRRGRIELAAWAPALIATGYWVNVFGGGGWSGERALLHPGLLLAMLISGGLCVIAWAIRTAGHAPWTTSGVKRIGVLACVAGSGLLVFAASSYEVARMTARVWNDAAARGAGVSIWWALLAVVLIGVGFVRVRAEVRHTGLALLGVAAAKALVFDLASVSAGGRVVSFLGIGLLMLGVGVAYQWAHKQQGAHNQQGAHKKQAEAE